MKKEVLLILLLISIFDLKVFSQKVIYDIMYYDEPSGWTRSDNPGHRSYTLINSREGTYGMIVIYPSIQSSGDADKDLTDSWDQLVKPTFGAGMMPKASKSQRNDGFLVLATGDEVEVKGKKTIVLLLDFTGSGRTVSVMLNYSNDSYSPAITSFLKSLSFKNNPIEQQLQPPKNTQPANSDDSPLAQTRSDMGNSATAKLIGNEGISGVWMSMVSQADFINGGYSTGLKCITIFKDGQIRENMPLEGYHFFDIARDKKLFPDNWGTISGANGIFSVQKTGASLYKGKISVTGDNKITFDSDSYMRIKQFDGLKLNGSWTSLANPDEDLKVGELEPVIYFYPDGRFEDKGILMVLDISAKEWEQRAGKGKYEISDYTLSLRYDDGRIRNYSITGLFTGSGLNDKSLVVCNVTLRKRNR